MPGQQMLAQLWTCRAGPCTLLSHPGIMASALQQMLDLPAACKRCANLNNATLPQRSAQGMTGHAPWSTERQGGAEVWTAAGQAGQDLTALAFEEAGLQCAVGTSEGLCAIFDLRAPKPLAIKDHMYGEPIRSVQFHQLPGESGVGHY